MISLKLDSRNASRARRLKDKADVTELVLRRKPPRDLAAAPAVRALCEEKWDTMEADH